MAKRKIIKIDREKCTGCGLCIPACPEGALRIIDGKATLVSELFCDGLGACIGQCPEGAITIEEKEAEPYDEKKVMENIIKQGESAIKAHLEHLKEHHQEKLLQQALEFLEERGIKIYPGEEILTSSSSHSSQNTCGCPGSKPLIIPHDEKPDFSSERKIPSQLGNWPIQMHLISPVAPYYREADVLLVADCVGYVLADFHLKYLKGKSLGIACPKLDSAQEIYLEKIKSWFDEANISSLTVMIMEVPCCRGLLRLVKKAAESASRKVPLKYKIAGIKGEILEEGEF
ncbi:4Fe-4S binding protein [Candidatus Aerophobetes bacterium]|nr:4Fe-4S binding protein [Candidatus Aerophobetes bacterium]